MRTGQNLLASLWSLVLVVPLEVLEVVVPIAMLWVLVQLLGTSTVLLLIAVVVITAHVVHYDLSVSIRAQVLSCNGIIIP